LVNVFHENSRVANWLMTNCLPNNVNFSKSEFFIRIESISVAAIKSKGEMGQPCLIPLSIENLEDVPCGDITELCPYKLI